MNKLLKYSLIGSVAALSYFSYHLFSVGKKQCFEEGRRSGIRETLSVIEAKMAEFEEELKLIDWASNNKEIVSSPDYTYLSRIDTSQENYKRIAGNLSSLILADSLITDDSRLRHSNKR
ncbi:MAG TPA: hypothetical protein VJH92_02235 [Candidatus Nanoarchaeia archaeon]|nr:hypothetical protein [Candidatus Nanoarchaeia archaeon]